MVAMPMVGAVGVAVRPSFKGVQREVGREFTGAGATAEKSFSSRFGKAVKAGLFATGAAAAAGFGTALVKGFGRLTAIENAQASLRGLGHDAKSVETIMQNANAAVKGTAFGLDSAATVAAAAVAAGIKPGEDLQKMLTLVGDSATIAGVGIEEMGAIFNKAAASNKVQMDIINQLHDAGVPALALLADQMGVTAEEASKMASKGEIDFATFSKAMEEGMGGAAQKSGETLQGAFANSMAAVGRFGANLMSEVYPKITAFFQGFMAWMGPMEDAAKVAGEALGDFADRAISGIQALWDLVVGGNFSADFREAFGVQEDHPFVDFLFNLREGVIDAYKAVSDFVSGGLAYLGDWLQRVGIPFLSTFADALFMKVTPFVWNLATTVAGMLLPVLGGLGAFFMEVLIPALTAVVGWIGDNIDWLGSLAIAVGVAVGAIALWTAAMKLNVAWQKFLVGESFIMNLVRMTQWFIGIARAQGLATAAQWALNKALGANPIAKIIMLISALVAGLVWFFTQTETGRKAWSAFMDFLGSAWEWLYNDVILPTVNWIVDAWNGMVAAIRDGWEKHGKGTIRAIGDWFSWLWSDVLSPTIDWIVGAWRSLMDGISWAWQNIGKPIFSAIGTVFAFLYNVIIAPYIGLIILYFQTMWKLAAWAWQNVAVPMFNAIKNAFIWVWQSVIQPVIGWITEKWAALMAGMKYAWENVLKPAIDAIRGAFTWLWQNAISPVLTWIQDKWKLMIDGMVWVWHMKLQPAIQNLQDRFEVMKQRVTAAWDFVKNTIRDTYEKYIKPVIDRFKDAIGSVPGKFEEAKNGIKSAWDKVKDVAKAPIRFVVNTVLNDGLISGFNTMVAWLPGVKELPKISLPKGFARGGYTGPGSKYQEAGIVHADEFVIRKESQNSISRAMPGLLDAMNKYGAKALGYASGGLVRPISGRVTSGFGASRGRYPHAGIDFAAPVGTPVFASMAGQVMRAGWNVLTGRTGIGAYLQHEGGRQTYYGHLSRLLVGIGDMVKKGQQIALSGNTGRSTGPHLHFETHSGGKPLNPAHYLSGAALPEGANVSGGGGFNPLQGLLDVGGKIGQWFTDKFPAAGMMVDAAKGVGLKAFEDLKEWASGKLSAVGDFAKDVWSNITGSGSVQEQVRKVAEGFGWGDVNGNQWRSLNELIRRESSWNPNAANPSSSARGLFQKMTSVHGPLEGTVAGQAGWGLNYIRSRYGNPQAAINHHDRRGWYADGGLVEGRDYLFRDQGGNLPPGLNLVLNKTGRDEWIFNQDQLGRLDSAVRGRGGNTYEIYVPHSGASAGDIVRTLEHNSRRLERV